MQGLPALAVAVLAAVGVVLAVNYVMRRGQGRGRGGPPEPKPKKGPVALDRNKKIAFELIKKEESRVMGVGREGGREGEGGGWGGWRGGGGGGGASGRGC